MERREQYQANREQWPADVRLATGDQNHTLFGTIDEFLELQAEFAKLFDKYRDRLTDASRRPEGWRLFEFQMFTHPVDTSYYAIEDEPEN